MNAHLWIFSPVCTWLDRISPCFQLLFFVSVASRAIVVHPRLEAWLCCPEHWHPLLSILKHCNIVRVFGCGTITGQILQFTFLLCHAYSPDFGLRRSTYIGRFLTGRTTPNRGGFSFLLCFLVRACFEICLPTCLVCWLHSHAARLTRQLAKPPNCSHVCAIFGEDIKCCLLLWPHLWELWARLLYHLVIPDTPGNFWDKVGYSTWKFCAPGRVRPIGVLPSLFQRHYQDVVYASYSSVTLIPANVWSNWYQLFVLDWFTIRRLIPRDSP